MTIGHEILVPELPRPRVRPSRHGPTCIFRFPSLLVEVPEQAEASDTRLSAARTGCGMFKGSCVPCGPGPVGYGEGGPATAAMVGGLAGTESECYSPRLRRSSLSACSCRRSSEVDKIENVQPSIWALPNRSQP